MESVISTVLQKTQSEDDQVRKCAIETLASLVLEDYLKFRGSILLYVLAATADKKKNIARLAHELIIKFANEKNAILIRSCLRECPFAFNDCKLVDNSEMFGSDLFLKSPLKSRTDDRRYIYRFLVHNMEVINCYMYFENFSTIKDRITKKDFKKTTEVVESVQDFLYICEHICKSKEMPKSKSAENAAENRSDEDGETTGVKGAVEAATSAPTTNKRNKQTTLPEAMVVVEKTISRFPELSTTLTELDPNFKTHFDQICFAIGEHFGDSIKYFPNLFWDKYRKSKPTKRTRRRNEDDDSDECDGNDASVSRIAKTAKRSVNQEARNKASGSVPMDESSSQIGVDTNITVVTKTPKRSANDDDTNIPVVTKTPKRSVNDRSARKSMKSMVIDDSGSDNDFDTSIAKTTKTPKRNAGEGHRSVRKANKRVIINDSDSDDDFEAVKRSSAKSPRLDVKRTPRRSKKH